jgi:membrane-bound serine protease (ClpP class)
MTVIAVLIVVGLVLLFLETILPGLIAGFLGLSALIGAIIYAYMELGIRAGNTTLFVVLALLMAGTILWIKFFPESSVARMFVSTGQIGTLGVDKPELLDQVGAALTPLRPAGTALINGKRVDVVTEGGFVEKGTPVRVVSVEGLRVVVRPEA